MRRLCPLRTRLLRTGASVTFAAVSLVMAPAVHADPDTMLDPVMQLLAKRGVTKPTEHAAAAPKADETVPPPLADAASDLFDRMQTRASGMVITALNFVGVRYKRGGNSAESGFDCSGFTRHIYEMSVGLALPRRAEQQAKAPGFVEVARSALQPGDLVFFHTLKHAFSHVGIYIGDNRFIHSPSAGGQVRTEDMGFAYWKKRFDGARRPDGAPLAVADLKALAAEPAKVSAPGAAAELDSH